jgi:tRNA-specific 2-thiouridylase
VIFVARKAGALVLFSGGLDSILAVKALQEQGIGAEAVHFTCPFYSSEWARRSAGALRIRLHEVSVDSAYFRLVAKPRRGYGSRMNPCIDCKAYMLRRAERLRGRLGLDFLATGEVVGERPFSQTRAAMMLVESEAGLVGRVLRPLSAGLLPPTLAESRGLVNRDRLLSLHGRSRKPQMALARRYGIMDYPAPAGGCLLTDPEYAGRLREHLRHEGSVSWEQAELLRHGRHFRLGRFKVVVGRNEQDNEAILGLAGRMGLVRLEVVGYPGPLTVIAGKGRVPGKVLEAAAGLTVRYSDYKGKGMVRVEVRRGRKRRVVEAGTVSGKVVEKVRI